MTDKENGFSFIWKIENFSMLPHQFEEELNSQSFVIEEWKEVNLWLSLFPKGCLDGSHVSIYLCKKKKDDELKLNFSVTIESAVPSSKITDTRENQVLNEDSIGFPTLVNLSKLLSNKELYLPKDRLTIRCDIIPLKESLEDVSTENGKKSIPSFSKENCVSRTCIEVQRRSIMWSIPNVKECMEKVAEISCSLKSALEATPSLKLTMFPKKRSKDDFIEIFIQQTSNLSKEECLFVKCKITLTSTHEDYQVFKESTHLFELDTSDVWSFPPFIKAGLLTNEKYHFVDDTLSLRFEFAFSYKDRIHHLENYYMPFTYDTRKKTSQLSSCLEHIYGDGKFSDIELKVAGKTFPYYKVLLCARSPVFADMFENDMKEKNSNVVEIDDFDADTVKRMLTYMHSDILEDDLSTEDACNLYTVADKYDIGSLKRSCSAFLMSELSVDSVCEILIIADVHQNELLMSSACEFINNHKNEVFFSTEWESLMDDNPVLTSKVMHQILTGKYQL